MNNTSLLLAIDWANVGSKAAQLILSLSLIVIVHEFGHYLLRVGEYQPPSAQALQVVLMHNPKQQGVPNAVGEYRVVHHPC